MIKLIYLFIFFTVCQNAYSQAKLPILKATSKTATVLDDDHLRKGYWYMMPENQPDIYIVENPKKPHKITFYTDVDSISFEVKPNETHDFYMVLNGKDSCLTRVSTILSKPKNYINTCSTCTNTSDTIPFTIGTDNKTYIKANINNTQPAKFQFDIGTSGCILKEKKGKSCNTIWDGSGEMGGVSGTTTVKTSKYNQIQLGQLIWDSIGLFSTKQTNWGTNGIIGNSILQEKIIELNYDNNILVFHNKMPILSNDYIKLEIKIRDGVPYIPITIDNGKTKATNWFMFDNGYDNCLLINKDFANTSNLYGSMSVIGKRNNAQNGKTETVMLPKLLIGNYELNNIPIDVQDQNAKNAYDKLLIGNDVLKRFNVILDFQNNFIYLKPSKLINEKYNNGEKFKRKIIGIVVGAVALIAGIIIYKKVKKK